MRSIHTIIFSLFRHQSRIIYISFSFYIFFLILFLRAYLLLDCNWTKCLKNQLCDVIKMSEMLGKMGKKTSKKEMDNHSFFMTSHGCFLRHFVQLLLMFYFVLVNNPFLFCLTHLRLDSSLFMGRRGVF